MFAALVAAFSFSFGFPVLFVSFAALALASGFLATLTALLLLFSLPAVTERRRFPLLVTLLFLMAPLLVATSLLLFTASGRAL